MSSFSLSPSRYCNASSLRMSVISVPRPSVLPRGSAYVSKFASFALLRIFQALVTPNGEKKSRRTPRKDMLHRIGVLFRRPGKGSDVYLICNEEPTDRLGKFIRYVK